ncbi:hypothetical protein BJV74DRAFT_978757 [Russula compacta]|nr:hypothetical protein BJV74DRAFT_978757 [Russula compacta]
MLYGVLCVQTYVYSYNFPNDRRSIKFLAYFVFLLETIQTALTGVDVYICFVVGFGDMDRLRNHKLSPIDGPTMDAPISLIVQGFYCYRIWTLNKRLLWLCVIIAILSVAQAIATAWGGINASTVGTYVVLKPCIYLWFITSALSDILIAVAMTSLLTKARECKGAYSSYVLPRVVRLTVETNALTAGVAIISFVVYIAFPNEIYFVFLTGVIEKLYSNTLFLTLNNRIYFRDHLPLGNSTCPDPALHPATSPLHFVQNRLSQSTRTSHTSVRPDTILRTLPEDPEKLMGDITIIDSDPKHVGIEVSR